MKNVGKHRGSVGQSGGMRESRGRPRKTLGHLRTYRGSRGNTEAWWRGAQHRQHAAWRDAAMRHRGLRGEGPESRGIAPRPSQYEPCGLPQMYARLPVPGLGAAATLFHRLRGPRGTSSPGKPQRKLCARRDSVRFADVADVVESRQCWTTLEDTFSRSVPATSIRARIR